MKCVTKLGGSLEVEPFMDVVFLPSRNPRNAPDDTMRRIAMLGGLALTSARESSVGSGGGLSVSGSAVVTDRSLSKADVTFSKRLYCFFGSRSTSARRWMVRGGSEKD